MRYRLRLLCLGLLLLACWAWPLRAGAGHLTVFAAASLKTALDEVAAEFSMATGHSVTHSFAGSSALARQIELGAPADVFISANTLWMDHVEKVDRIATDTRLDLVGNHLVLIARFPSEETELGPETPLAAMLGEGRLAMALVNAVPAGMYGKASLQRLGLWDGISARVVQTDNVRAALKLVAMGEARMGVVYVTDALAEPGVSVLGRFPQESHAPIIYPVAAIEGRVTEPVRDYLAFLRGADARAVFERHGFTVLAEGE